MPILEQKVFTSLLTLTYTGEPIEKCNSSSCMWHEYLLFRNNLIKKFYSSMVEKFDNIMRLNIKNSNLFINIDWFSSKFNDDLFEYDFGKIKDSIKDVLQVSGFISRRDKLFNSDFIEINRHFHNKDEDFFIVNINFDIKERN
jgi:hypothetical protein